MSSMGVLLSEAQGVSPLTLSVPGSAAMPTKGSRALELDNANSSTIIVDAASATRTIKTSERESTLPKYEAPSPQHQSWAGCEQGKDYNRIPRNQGNFPLHGPHDHGLLDNSQNTKTPRHHIIN